MSGFNYRVSVIPAGAIIDRGLEPRDLQVLCLLGRHTNKAGWCYRSQVTMAREIGCGRSSVQRSLDRLYTTGWVQKKLRAVGDAVADPAHPHASHAYRVILDRDDLPGDQPDDEAEVEVEEEAEKETQEAKTTEENTPAAEGGVPTGGHPVPSHTWAPGAQPCVGTHILKDDSKGEVNQDERERVRARKDERLRLRQQFKKRYPSAAVDSHAAIDREWELLPDEQMQPAIEGVEAFVAELKRMKRSHVPSAATYLHERKWIDLPKVDAPPKEQTFVTFQVWSREWWAMLLAKADRGEPLAFTVDHAKQQRSRETSERADRMPSPETIARLKSVPGNGDWMTHWRPWFEQRGAKLPLWREAVWIFLPSPEPPIQGQPALREDSNAQSTGPPIAPLTETEKRELSGL